MNLQLLGLLPKIDAATREELFTLLQTNPQAAATRFVEIAASHGVACDPDEILKTLGLPPVAEIKPEQLQSLVEGARSKLKMLSMLGGFK